MAKLTPGMKQDWKHRPSQGGQPMNRMVRLLFTATLFLILLGVLIWFLLPPSEQRTYFFPADSIDYDLWATIPLVHSSVAEELGKDGNYDPKSFFMSRSIALEETLPPIEQLAAQAANGNIPGPNDACVLYIQAHTLRYDVDGTPHVVLATPTFLRYSFADWETSGVLDLSVVLDWMETADCPLKLILLDAGTIVTDGHIDLYENNFASALESEMRGRKDSNLFLITSHQDGQKSLSLSLQRNSIFSQAVQEALTGKGISDLSGDDTLDLSELYHHICVRVQNHLEKGEVAQTPRLFQGGQGILTEDFPKKFVCRYFQQPKKEEDAKDESAEAKEPEATLPATKPDADKKEDAEKDDAKKDGEPDKEQDSRWTTLNEIWEVRDQLAQPPGNRNGMIWSPIDFAPQYFRRLDSILIGYQFHLLFNTGDVLEDELTTMKNSLDVLQASIQEQRKVSSRKVNQSNSNEPADNLIGAWNEFVDTPYQQAWSADLTEEGIETRDSILKWNYCVYHVPELTEMFEHTGANKNLDAYESLLKEIHEVTIGMLELPPSGTTGPELTHLPQANIIESSLNALERFRRLDDNEKTIRPLNKETSNLNARMVDALRLIGYLRTAMPKAADRQEMANSLQKFSQQSIPGYDYVDNSIPALELLSTSKLPRAPAVSMKRLRQLYLKIVAAGSPPSEDSSTPFVDIGNTIQTNMSSDAEYATQVLYQVRVRALDWRDTPQIVGEVAPLPFRFPIRKRIARLVVQNGNVTQKLQLDRVAEKVDFKIDLVATNFPPGKVEFTVDYDQSALDVTFKNDNEDIPLVDGKFTYMIDASGPITIRGNVSAKLDREENAQRENEADILASEIERVIFSIPDNYVPVGGQSNKSCELSVSLPWAEEIDVVVKQDGASGPGIYYGERVQIPLFDNRESEFSIGLINRSRIDRKVNVAIYPVIRPAGSVMPTGRIFSDQYHRKPLKGGSNSQEAELRPWLVATYERPSEELIPTAVASDISLTPFDQIPPPTTRERGRIINQPVEPDRCEWLRFTGPPAPPGPDGKPGEAGKVTPTDITNGLLVVIEDQENKNANNKPVRWMRWIEWVPRKPQSYLDVQTSLWPADQLSRLEVIVRPITGDRSLPTASWDEERLYGFPNLPTNLEKLPINVDWDYRWENTFAKSELKDLQTHGTISSPESTAIFGAILTLDTDKPTKRPILLDLSTDEKHPVLRRAFRNVMDLSTRNPDADRANDTGKSPQREAKDFNAKRLDAVASAGFEALRLDSYTPHLKDEQKPQDPVPVMISAGAKNLSPIILPTDSETIDWNMAISTDLNSFNGASEIDPDKIQLGLVQGENTFERGALEGFYEKIYSNRSFSAKLISAQAEGPLVISSSLQDIVASGLRANPRNTFVGAFVVEIFKRDKKVEDLRIPIVIDKDPPTINNRIPLLKIPINESREIKISTQDNDSGVDYLEYGSPGPGDSIAGEALKLPAEVGNIVPNPNDTFLRTPTFLLNIRPEKMKWEVNVTHELRVRAVNRAGLKSEPLDLLVRVGPKSEVPMNEDGPDPLMVIKAQIIFVNGDAARELKYKPKIKDLALEPTLDPDGITWVFESKELKPGTTYTLVSSARQSSGGIKSAEAEAQATPAKDSATIVKLKFN